MKVLLIDNGTKLLADLQDLIPGSEITKTWRDVAPPDGDGFDLIVLSGSSASSVVWDHLDFMNEIELIKAAKTPIIGICFGCELIVHAFGGTLKELPLRHEGIRDIKVLSPDLSDKASLSVYEHHRWGIDRMPDGFAVLARSKDGPEAIGHKTRPIYGLQFHPEHFVDQTEGKDVFIDLLARLAGTGAGM